MDAFRASIDAEVQSILDGSFKVVVTDTDVVPSIDDPGLTFPNLNTGQQNCKLLRSCILHVDIRDSTVIGDSHRRETLVKLYSSFVRSMNRCASYFGGRVRNIVGDRVMVLFDKQNCFTNAVKTAILMNSVAIYVLNQRFTLNTIRCGVGIDYGDMLIAKTGTIRRGGDLEGARELVWLGRPANVASKLADNANKSNLEKFPVVFEGYRAPWGTGLQWVDDVPLEAFLDRLHHTFSPTLVHPDPNFSTFFVSCKVDFVTFPPILMTKAVFDGFRVNNPSTSSIRPEWWTRQGLEVPGYDGEVYGGSVHYTVFSR